MNTLKIKTFGILMSPFPIKTAAMFDTYHFVVKLQCYSFEIGYRMHRHHALKMYATAPITTHCPDTLPNTSPNNTDSSTGCVNGRRVASVERHFV